MLTSEEAGQAQSHDSEQRRREHAENPSSPHRIIKSDSGQQHTGCTLSNHHKYRRSADPPEKRERRCPGKCRQRRALSEDHEGDQTSRTDSQHADEVRP